MEGVREGVERATRDAKAAAKWSLLPSLLRFSIIIIIILR